MAVRASVIIPVYGGASLTQRCLDALLGGLPADEKLDVIVVDDASPDSTAELLAGYGERIRVITHSPNRGFARSCNEGAAAASGEHLVFLNNDTLPTPGWLETLVGYADANPRAAAVGAKLLYPNETVQHAGVVICQDRYPRHLYAGFPSDHPAVCGSRALQAVTGACMLVRREAFEQVGGFDTAFRNSYEDVDLCLRLGVAGHEVHYCAESVLYHLESASRGRSSKDVEESLKVYRRRWLHRVEPDDLKLYAADGLLELDYEDAYPVRLSFSRELAVLDADRGSETEHLLGLRSRQVASLLQEVVRLTVLLAERGGSIEQSPLTPEPGGEPPYDHAHLLERDEELQAAIAELQADVLSEQNDSLLYPRLVRRVREVAARALPADATVLVASKGDDELLRLDGREAWHFPQTDDGTYAGRHPADDREVVAQLEDLRGRGAGFLLVPEPSFWWLEHYGGLRAHLEGRYRLLVRDENACAIYALRGEESP